MASTFENANPRHSKSRFSRQATWRGLLLLFFFLLILGLFCYLTYRNECLKSDSFTALSSAESIASGIDAKRFSQSMNAKTNDEYRQFMLSVVNDVKKRTDTERIYVLGMPEGDQYPYFVTTRISTEPSHLQRDDFFAEEIKELYVSGKASAVSGVYESQYDRHTHLIGGFARIADASGKMLGVVGVDINVDHAYRLSSQGERIKNALILVSMHPVIDNRVSTYIGDSYVENAFVFTETLFNGSRSPGGWPDGS